MIKITTGTRFRTDTGLHGEVLYQIEMAKDPARPLKTTPIDQYRVRIERSAIEYASSRQIRAWEKNLK